MFQFKDDLFVSHFYISIVEVCSFQFTNVSQYTCLFWGLNCSWEYHLSDFLVTEMMSRLMMRQLMMMTSLMML